MEETKDRDYLFVASVHPSEDLDPLRTLVRGMVPRAYVDGLDARRAGAGCT